MHSTSTDFRGLCARILCWWIDERVKFINIGDISRDNFNFGTYSHVDNDRIKKAKDF